MNQYTANTLITLSLSLTVAATGAPIEASSLTLRIRTPDGLVTDISSGIINTSTGAYTAPFLAVQIGVHTYQWTSSGTAPVASVSNFQVTTGVI